MPFKSPARTPGIMGPTTPLSSRRRPGLEGERTIKGVGGVEQLSDDVLKLKEKLKVVEREMEGLAENYSEDELQVHIDRLHKYNEVKDVGQLLLGKIAEVESTTTAALYQQFGLETGD